MKFIPCILLTIVATASPMLANISNASHKNSTISYSVTLQTSQSTLLNNETTTQPLNYTSIRPTIENAKNGKKISGAKIIIIENCNLTNAVTSDLTSINEKKFIDNYVSPHTPMAAPIYTDKNGNCDNIKIPFVCNHNLPECEFGTVTIIVTHEGFNPTILQNCTTYKTRSRLGPVIPLFPLDKDTSKPDDFLNPKPFIITESPPEEWAENLIKFYC